MGASHKTMNFSLHTYWDSFNLLKIATQMNLGSNDNMPSSSHCCLNQDSKIEGPIIKLHGEVGTT